MHWIVMAAVAAVYFGGNGIKNFGEGLNDVSNGSVKMAGAALIGWYLFTQTKVFK